MAARKRKSLSIKFKLKLIEEVENGAKKADICRKNNISSSTLSTILKDKDKIKSASDQGVSRGKKVRTCNFQDVDTSLLLWFRQARSSNVPISGPILIEKGEEIAKHLAKVGRFQDERRLARQIQASSWNRHEVCGW